MRLRLAFVSLGLLAATGSSAAAGVFGLPTANRALLEPGAEERFFVGTVGKPWTSGTFGCVRTEGWQMHEGIDIRCLQRDKRGEPTDPVQATADGVVMYLNKRPALSNYGVYLILRHQVDGLEVYSTYAHLREIRSDLQPGQAVKAGERIAVMGRTTNTGEPISKDRAHVHFEINLLVNDRFPQWYQATFPTQRNDHAEWNGQNLLGLDPRLILLEQQRLGAAFNLLEFVRGRTELFRVAVRKAGFPWLKRYPALVKATPRAAQEGVAGYELAIDYNGIPFEIIPRAAAELRGKSKYHLLSVNAAEYDKRPCRRLVSRTGSRFQLASHGVHLLDLLTY